MTLFVPSYLGLSLLGLAHNPPMREEAGRYTIRSSVCKVAIEVTGLNVCQLTGLEQTILRTELGERIAR